MREKNPRIHHVGPKRGAVSWAEIEEANLRAIKKTQNRKKLTSEIPEKLYVGWGQTPPPLYPHASPPPPRRREEEGVRAPNNNPFGYKFSWFPRGVLLAATRRAVFLEDGKQVELDGSPGHTIYARGLPPLRTTGRTPPPHVLGWGGGTPTRRSHVTLPPWTPGRGGEGGVNSPHGSSGSYGLRPELFLGDLFRSQTSRHAPTKISAPVSIVSSCGEGFFSRKGLVSKDLWVVSKWGPDASDVRDG